MKANVTIIGDTKDAEFEDRITKAAMAFMRRVEEERKTRDGKDDGRDGHERDQCA